MLTYVLDHSAAAPLYTQLYEAIKRDLLSGAIQGGEKLPSKRLLAEHLDISKVTVEAAYQQLLSEGYLTARERVGYFAEHITPLRTAPVAAPEPPAHLAVPGPAARQFPVSVWSRLTRKVLLGDSNAMLQPVPGTGLPVLRAAIVQELRRSRDMKVSSEQILVGSGAEFFYHVLIQLLGRNRRYGLESPGHQKIAAVYTADQVAVAAVSLDGNGVTLDSLRRSGADVLHISPSHQFPTGIVMPIRRRQELMAWLSEREDRYLIEDDYDAEFHFSGRPIPTMQSLDPTGRVIYMNTFSKTIAPSLRISYLVLPPRLMAEYRRRLGFYSCTVPSLEQLTLAQFLSEGYFEKHLNRMRKHYRLLRDRLLAALRESRAADCLSIQAEDSGLHFILTADGVSDSAAFCAGLSLHGLTVSPLARYYMGTPDPEAARRFVFDYGNLEEAGIPAVVTALEALLPGK
ncbi:MAG: PLP-dependent aminotransferase family protein [Oscillospiraceae bacterium]|nr:PLP-dependent aminotransferase family protein [Oscillospiraceae bacterium]